MSALRIPIIGNFESFLFYDVLLSLILINYRARWASDKIAERKNILRVFRYMNIEEELDVIEEKLDANTFEKFVKTIPHLPKKIYLVQELDKAALKATKRTLNKEKTRSAADNNFVYTS